MDKESQEAWLDRVRGGEFAIIVFSPPCGSWSRANWRGGTGPKPCRSREFPWGFPNSLAPMRKRAEKGNECIHFSIRAMEAAHVAKVKRGVCTRTLLEHPEDLVPAPAAFNAWSAYGAGLPLQSSAACVRPPALFR
mgnify:CR=1 FL=1